MASKANTKEQLQQAIDLVAEHGSSHAASKATGIPSMTIKHRYDKAVMAGLEPTPGITEGASKNFKAELEIAKDRIKVLEKRLVGASRDSLNSYQIKEKIIELRDTEPKLPAWIIQTKASKGSPGAPSLLCSDWHWGEVIDPSQIGGVNKYNLAIAHDRARRLIERTIDLLFNHMVNPSYPGIVFNLGGDMVSGDIHEELTETNELPIMPVVTDLFGTLIWCINTLADRFGNVFVPCVTGNHGRNTHKMRAKGRHHTSFDWLVYVLLQKHFEGDKRISFLIPDGPDALYQVYNHRYLLTHGDQFRGGDGMIGALGPITRGDHKKRSRNGAVDMNYDTMLMGHWHQYLPLDRIIVNGSLCGYNEYANQGNFMFEEPRQALWMTHPKHGMTFRMPVYVDDRRAQAKTTWIRVAA